jgi:hypothetical protein
MGAINAEELTKFIGRSPDEIKEDEECHTKSNYF